MINKQKIKYITQRAILTGTLSLTLLSGKTINTNAHEIKSNYSNFYEVDEENDKKIVNITEKFKKIITDEINKGHSFYMIIEDHPEFNITERTLYYSAEKRISSCSANPSGCSICGRCLVSFMHMYSIAGTCF